MKSCPHPLSWWAVTEELGSKLTPTYVIFTQVMCSLGFSDGITQLTVAGESYGYQGTNCNVQNITGNQKYYLNLNQSAEVRG